MNNTAYEVAAILAKEFNREVLSNQEQILLEEWLRIPENQSLYGELLKNTRSEDFIWLSQLNEDDAWERVVQKGKIRKISWRKLVTVAAAVLFCVLSVGIYYKFKDKASTSLEIFTMNKGKKYGDDASPANLGARIILSTGDQMKVDDTLNVSLNNRLMESDPLSNNSALLNTLVVPTANFFKLVLVDGTVVWVNAGSELRFPSQFGSLERRVYLKGEAYFEVAKNASKPFYVETPDLAIKVLGTHFNVTAYGLQSTTTLKEGSVEVIKGEKSLIISPGQSVEWLMGEFKAKKANLDRDLAWKNNLFYFNGDNIVDIAQQLKRWYDLEISFADNVSLTTTYSGEIRRDVKLSEVLDMLSFVCNLDFKLTNNKLLIFKKASMK